MERKIYFKVFMKKLCLSVFCALFSLYSFADNAVVYKYAPGAPKSERYVLTLDSKECHVYPTPLADIAPFDITGKTLAVVKAKDTIESFDIRPLSKKIVAKLLDEKTLQFEIPGPCNLSVEINGIKHPLFIFANPPVKNPPKKGDKNVMFFEAGKLHDLGLRTQLPSNTTVYVEGGAVVYGSFRIGDRYKVTPMENVRICGNGIISCEKIPPAIEKRGPSSQGIEFHNTSNVNLEGFCIVQSPNWTIPMFACRDVHINNIKTVSEIGWDDGIDVVSCKNVLIENCFLRNKDDCIAIKAGVNYAPKYFKHDQPNNVENVTVRKCVIWNSIWGNGLEIGFETRGDEIKNIVFEDIDIIHTQCNPKWKEGKEGTFTIHNGDRAKIHNVLYKNIRVEDPENYLMDIRIMFSRYSKDKNRGKIHDIRFEDIYVTTKGPLKNIFEGFSEDSSVSGVRLKNVFINGKPFAESKDISIEIGKYAEIPIVE